MEKANDGLPSLSAKQRREILHNASQRISIRLDINLSKKPRRSERELNSLLVRAFEASEST